MAGRPPKPTPSQSAVPLDGQRYFRIAEAAVYLRCAPRFIGDAIREGQLPRLQMGKRFIIVREDLDKFALSLRENAA